MTKSTFSFSSSAVNYYFDASFDLLVKLVSADQAVIITDENVFAKHKKKFTGFKTIVVKAGEAFKNQSTVDDIISQLIDAGADRKTTLVGIGGGVITDMTGYVAGIFMRGISFGFVPTSILAMVDAAIGGKNGVDVGVYKNMVGLIKQPSFVLFDYDMLKTLPKEEWINGFAEIIKHSAIKDAAMFKLLEENKLPVFQKDKKALASLIKRNVLLKTKVVVSDEFERGDRKLLNFGHTLGHAIENVYQIPHGHAISIGMGAACALSENVNGFSETGRVTSLLKKYGLPPQFDFDKTKAFEVLQKDKKKTGKEISFVLLKKVGKAEIKSLPLEELNKFIHQL